MIDFIPVRSGSIFVSRDSGWQLPEIPRLSHTLTKENSILSCRSETQK